MQGIVYTGNRRTEKSEWTVRSPKTTNVRNHEKEPLEDKGNRKGYQSTGDEVTWLKLALQRELKPQKKGNCYLRFYLRQNERNKYSGFSPLSAFQSSVSASNWLNPA